MIRRDEFYPSHLRHVQSVALRESFFNLITVHGMRKPQAFNYIIRRIKRQGVVLSFSDALTIHRHLVMEITGKYRLQDQALYYIFSGQRASWIKKKTGVGAPTGKWLYNERQRVLCSPFSKGACYTIERTPNLGTAIMELSNSLEILHNCTLDIYDLEQLVR